MVTATECITFEDRVAVHTQPLILVINKATFDVGLIVKEHTLSCNTSTRLRVTYPTTITSLNIIEVKRTDKFTPPHEVSIREFIVWGSNIVDGVDDIDGRSKKRVFQGIVELLSFRPGFIV